MANLVTTPISTQFKKSSLPSFNNQSFNNSSGFYNNFRGFPSCGHGPFTPQGGGLSGHGRGFGHFSQFSKPNMGTNNGTLVCQLCNKIGHEALQCYYGFDATFTRPSQLQGQGQI